MDEIFRPFTDPLNDASLHIKLPETSIEQLLLIFFKNSGKLWPDEEKRLRMLS